MRAAKKTQAISFGEGLSQERLNQHPSKSVSVSRAAQKFHRLTHSEVLAENYTLTSLFRT
jgi:hypothetical protein